MIVLHKIKDGEMLLEKRSSIYSDRPVFNCQAVSKFQFPWNECWTYLCLDWLSITFPVCSRMERTGENRGNYIKVWGKVSLPSYAQLQMERWTWCSSSFKWYDIALIRLYLHMTITILYMGQVPPPWWSRRFAMNILRDAMRTLFSGQWRGMKKFIETQTRSGQNDLSKLVVPWMTIQWTRYAILSCAQPAE